jgi:hypothetical protein
VASVVCQPLLVTRPSPEVRVLGKRLPTQEITLETSDGDFTF